MRVGGSIFGVLITWSSWGVWQHSPQQEYSHGHDIVRSGRHSRLFSLHDWNLKDFFCENQTFLHICGVDCIFVLLLWWWGNICTWWGNICTSSAMISDCSSRLKRLERRPPASTLLMYSRNPWGEKVGSLVRDQTVDLLLDVLVCEEESGSCAWWGSFKTSKQK